VFTFSEFNGGWEHVFIDSELNARDERFVEVIWNNDAPWSQTHQPQNQAENYLYELGVFPYRALITIGDWIYYSWNEAWSECSWWSIFGNLYRINIDGTRNTLLREENDISALWNINDRLLATIFVRPSHDSDIHKTVVLSHDGKIENIFGGGWDGHNSVFWMQQVADTGIVMAIQNSWIQGLYCTITGALFTLYNPENFNY